MSIKPMGMVEGYRAGGADIIIFPLVTLVLVLKAITKQIFSVLVHLLDFAFFVAMELTRFPLFLLRASGDGIIAALRALVGHLPLAQERRHKWIELIGRRWSQVRQAISYRAFEQFVHHAFERGMEWVFRKCRTLSPRTALYVIIGALLWLPISAGLATAMHALLLAKATSLPPWMQLLHPFATLIAKSKLLILPVYPAAWPQAKKHPLLLAIFRAYRDFESLYLIQKLEHRYRQTEQVIASLMQDMRRGADMIGLSRVCGAIWSGVRSAGVRIAAGYRDTKFIIFQRLSRTSLIGPLVQSYLCHLDSMERRNERMSAKVKRGFDKWFVKFSAEYYEAKEAEKAAKAASEKIPEAHSAPDAAMVSLKPSQALPPRNPIG